MNLHEIFMKSQVSSESEIYDYYDSGRAAERTLESFNLMLERNTITCMLEYISH